MEYVKDYWAIIAFALVVIWHLITQYFSFIRYKEKLADCDKRTLKNSTDIKTVSSEMNNGLNSLRHEILLQVAEQDKEILFRLADQEKRNGENTLAITKLFGTIEKQLEGMSIGLNNINILIKTVSDRTESMERERMQDLKDQLDQLRTKHEQK